MHNDARADHTDILLGVYAAERSDEQNTATLLTAIGTGVLAYIIGATAYFADPDAVDRTPWWILLAAPFPLLILMAYTTFQYAASRLRQSYIICLEGLLSERDEWDHGAGFPGYMALQQGLFAGKSGRQSPFVPLTIITFLSHALVMAVFTTFVLWKVFVAANRQVIGTNWWVVFSATYVIMMMVYATAIGLNFWAMLRMVNFTTEGERSELTLLRIEAQRIVETERRRWQTTIAADPAALRRAAQKVRFRTVYLRSRQLDPRLRRTGQAA